jgi:hypothetical protein
MFGHDTPIAVGDLLHDALPILLEHIYCDSVLRDNSFRVAGRIYPSSASGDPAAPSGSGRSARSDQADWHPWRQRVQDLLKIVSEIQFTGAEPLVQA